MVSKKRLDYEFNGHRAPNIPRAPRSIRRRGPRKNSVEDSKLCAFELLATVAGKLLQESESSASSNVAEGKVDPGSNGTEKGRLIDDKGVKSDGSCAESAFVPEVSVQDHKMLSCFKGQPSEHTSVHEKSDVLTKVDCDLNVGICEVKDVDGNNATSEVESGREMRLDDEKDSIGDVSTANTSTVKDPIKECVNTNVLINSENTVQMPFRRDTVSDALLKKHRNNVKLGIRDDDDNSFRCNKSCTNVRPFRRQPCIGHRRIRKMLTSRYRKGAPKFKGCEVYNASDGMKLFYQYRKRVYTQERCQQAPIKKRKLYNDTYAVAYDHDMSSDSISNLPEKGTRIDKSSSTFVSERASDTSARGHKKAKDAHVKFSIKSFKVPELYIEVPETASVASLKRTVMEAVTAILGSGIRVGVVLQGKKVREDNRTLQQAGISHNSNLDTLGFTLEPSFTHVSPSTSAKKLPSISPRGENQDLPRAPATPMVDSGISNASVDPPHVTKSDDVDNNEIIYSPQTPVNKVINGGDPDSKALVPVSPMNEDALAVVPVNPKPKRNELSQRRTRRPFSVAEVEALVSAVEKLGTGRWRDVKLGAFERADHRTYVDLKDKWKTLVHTASIAPQQRRGEPVPQELLDRVLSAHTYWSMHQSKQHGKHPVEPIKTVDRPDEVVRA